MLNMGATKEEQGKHNFATCTCIQYNLKYCMRAAQHAAAASVREDAAAAADRCPLMSGDVDGLVAAERGGIRAATISIKAFYGMEVAKLRYKIHFQLSPPLSPAQLISSSWPPPP